MVAYRATDGTLAFELLSRIVKELEARFGPRATIPFTQGFVSQQNEDFVHTATGIQSIADQVLGKMEWEFLQDPDSIPVEPVETIQISDIRIHVSPAHRTRTLFKTKDDSDTVTLNEVQTEAASYGNMKTIIPEEIQPEDMQVGVAKELASLPHPSVPDWPGSPGLLPASPNKDGSPFKGHLLQMHLTQWTLQDAFNLPPVEDDFDPLFSHWDETVNLTKHSYSVHSKDTQRRTFQGMMTTLNMTTENFFQQIEGLSFPQVLQEYTVHRLRFAYPDNSSTGILPDAQVVGLPLVPKGHPLRSQSHWWLSHNPHHDDIMAMPQGPLMYLFIMAYYLVLDFGPATDYPSFIKTAGLTVTPAILTSMMQTYISLCEHSTSLYRKVHKREVPGGEVASVHMEELSEASSTALQALSQYNSTFFVTAQECG